ncbi:MAG: hypothetical protein KJ051_11025 [Thermoleophilia bacterium]|nr:hypothetical protein [Thermoleophilia bacterium]
MEEAARVLARLGRIDELRRADAAPGLLLDELRLLVREGEAWAAAERGTGEARRALAALEDALAAGARQRRGEEVTVPRVPV